jgi:hypothetical protein
MNHKIAKMMTSMKQTQVIENQTNENPNRPVRIVKGYTDDQEGKDIRDENVERQSNGKWTKQGSPETHSWKDKSLGRCPMYGPCSHCYKAGPAGKKGICTHGDYIILFDQRHVIDSIKIAELLEEELEVAKADRMVNWIRTPTMQFNYVCCNLAIIRRINQDNASLSNDAKKILRKQRLTAVWDLMNDIPSIQ